MSRKEDLSDAVPVTHPHAVERFDVLRTVSSAIWIFDLDMNRIVMANDSAIRLWHAESEEELRKRDFSVDMSPTVQDRLRQYINDAHKGSSFNEMWTLYPKGVPTSVMVAFSGFVLNDGRMALLCQATPDNQNSTFETPDNIRSTEALLYTDVMITLYREQGDVLYMNPAARRAVSDGTTYFRQHFVDPEEHDDILHVVASRGDVRAVTQMHTIWGQSWHDLSIKKCVDAVTGEPAYLVTAVDVTDLKTARDKARFLADCDQLTGCYNRAFFSRQMESIQFERGPATRGILCLDLDRFKHYNDAFGHEGGDTVLCTVAQRIQSCLGPNDILARFGGDEFVVLLEYVDDEAGLLIRSNAIKSVISQPVNLKSSRMTTTCSIGAALLPEHASDWAEYMKRADIALYAAKEAGRDRCMVYDTEMGRAAQERHEIETDLKSALAENQFILHYQPRVDTISRKVTSVEALVRWQHPTKGLIPPNDFIPICEETGMIEDLGYFVIREAIAQITQWDKQGLDIGISINVSPRQFLDEKLMLLISELAIAPDFPQGKIELEITETVLIGDHELIADRLQQMTDMGFRIAIDDFGTGYSNLAYISLFPLDCIKIDKSFIDQLPTSKPIISLIQTLADEIGASTVAEGVETLKQVKDLEHLGCNQLQGYYYSKPLPEKQVQAKILNIAEIADAGTRPQEQA